MHPIDLSFFSNQQLFPLGAKRWTETHNDDGYMMLSHNEHFFIHSKKVIKEKDYTGSDISYKINKDLFRSEQFEKLNSDSINILVAGCSWTFGEGCKIENTWPIFLKNKVQEFTNKNVRVHNLGVMGGSTDLAIKNILSFMNIYGRPDYIFIASPFHGRSVLFNSQNEPFNSTIHFPNYKEKEKKNRKAMYEYLSTYNELSIRLNFTLKMQLFELYLNSINIPFRWFFAGSNLDDPTNMYQYGFNNYIHIEHYFSDKYDKKIPFSDPEQYPNFMNLEYWSLSKDKYHPGGAWHWSAASQLFEKVWMNA